jgi:hypothetical protein
MSRLPTQSFGLRHKNGTAILMGFSGLRMDRETMELHMVDVLSHNHSIPKFIGRFVLYGCFILRIEH